MRINKNVILQLLSGKFFLLTLIVYSAFKSNIFDKTPIKANATDSTWPSC